jgi:uncharacterized protein (TIGR03083 family)
MNEGLDALHRSVDRLHGLAADLTPEQLVLPAYPTEWTIADTLSHIGSGAVILGRRVEDILSGTDPDPDFNQSVWDDWNARTPEDQAAGALEADAGYLAAVDALSEAQRADFRFEMGPFQLDFTGFIGLRLNEHVLHTWDVEVALVPSATLPTESVGAVLDNLGIIVGFAGKPTGTELTVHFSTTGPDRQLTLALGADSVQLSPSAPGAATDLELPAEALVRLVYGRLDADHAPSVSDEALLAELRKAFPGF